MKTAKLIKSTRSDDYIVWLYKKLKINNHFVKNQKKISSWKINRGAMYTCYFGENLGHEKSRLEARPCVVVSSNDINYNSSNIIVVPLSKNIKYADTEKKVLKYPHHYVLKKKNYAKLEYDSVVQCEDIRCVSKARLVNYICNVSKEDMKNISKRIKTALQI